MLIRFILIAPIIIGVILILIGVLFYLNRTKFGIHTVGTIVGTDEYEKKYAKIKMNVEAPVVRYSVNGQQYECTSSKYLMDGMQNYKKGSIINIRVSKRNPRRFKPVQSGDRAEKILICCGTAIIFAYIVLYFRYF